MVSIQIIARLADLRLTPVFAVCLIVFSFSVTAIAQDPTPSPTPISPVRTEQLPPAAPLPDDPPPVAGGDVLMEATG